METNLLTHQIAKEIQELARPEYQGDGGFQRVVSLINDGLEQIGSDVIRAGTSDYRKMYHVSWKSLMATVCDVPLQETLNDRFKRLVF